MSSPMADYAAEFPPILDPLAYECFGRHGYGDGRVLGANATGPPLGPTHVHDGRIATSIEGGCKACDRAGDCWTATRAKAAELFPVLAELEREIGEEFQGGAFLSEWQRRTEQTVGDGRMVPPPSLMLSAENIRQGAHAQVRFVMGDLG